MARVTAAVEKIRAALASPEALLAQAGREAVQAIDQELASLVLRISDGGLRDLASGALALVRDLCSSGGAGDSLRTDVKALVGRALALGQRWLLGALPAGPATQLLGEALDGLRSLVTSPQGLAAATLPSAESLLAGVKRGLLALLRSVLQDLVPDRATSSFIARIVQETVEVVTNPERWRQLLSQGFAYFVSRVVPALGELASGALQRVAGASDTAQQLVSGFFGALSRVVASPAELATFLRETLSSFVGLAVSTATPLVTSLIERQSGNPALSRFVAELIEDAAAALADPSKLTSFLALGAREAVRKVLEKARSLAELVIGHVVKDETLRGAVTGGFSLGLEYLTQVATGAAADLGATVKQRLSELVQRAAAVLKTKLASAFPGTLAFLRPVLERGYDALVAFAVDLIERGPREAAARLGAGDASRLLGQLVDGVMPLVKAPVQAALSYEPLRRLIGGGGGAPGLLDLLGTWLKDSQALRNLGTPAGLGALLSALHGPLDRFAQAVLVEPLPGGSFERGFVAMLKDGLLGLLRPKAPGGAPKLADLVERIRSGNVASLVSDLGDQVLTGLLGRIDSKTVCIVARTALKCLLEMAGSSGGGLCPRALGELSSPGASALCR
jgi:hypothetical protein